MPLKLVLNGLEFALDGARLRVGRADHLDVSIHGDPLISSQHCVIDSGLLCDAASTNGTTINGQKIRHAQQYQLKAGDVVTLGETQLYIVEGAPFDGSVPLVNGQPLPPASQGAAAAAAGGAAGGAVRVKKPVMPRPSSAAGGAGRISKARTASALSQQDRDGAAASSFLYTRPPATAPASPTAANIAATAAAPVASSASSSSAVSSASLPAYPFGSSSASSFATAGSSFSPLHRPLSATSLRSASNSEMEGSRLLDMSLPSVDDSLNSSGALLDLSHSLLLPASHRQLNGGGDDREGGPAAAGNGRFSVPHQVLDDDSLSMDDSTIALDSGSLAAFHRASPRSATEPVGASDFQPQSSSAMTAAERQQAALDQTRVQDGTSPFDSPHTQIRKLQAALRETEVRYGRLERKLAHSQRKSSALPDLHKQAAKVADLEAQNASLSYQILYGDAPKDQEIRQLKDEIDAYRSRLQQPADSNGVKPETAGHHQQLQQRGGGGGGGVGDSAEAVFAVKAAVELLSSTRDSLLSAVDGCASQASSLLSLHQAMAVQQQQMMELSISQQREGDDEGSQHRSSSQQLAGQQQQQLTAAIAAMDRRIKDDQADIVARLSSIHRDLTTQQQHSNTAALLMPYASTQQEESKQRDASAGETGSSSSSSLQSDSTLSLSSSSSLSPSAAPSYVSAELVSPQGQKQLASLSAQMQQVWLMVAALLALVVGLIALRR